MKKLLLLAAAALALASPAAAACDEACVRANRIVAHDDQVLTKWSEDENAQSNGTILVRRDAENLLRSNSFSGLTVTVYPPEDWTPERRKQFGLETAQRYCASLGPKLQAQIWSVRVFLDDFRTFVADCKIKPAGNGE
jgi:hypothetical protein